MMSCDFLAAGMLRTAGRAAAHGRSAAHALTGAAAHTTLGPTHHAPGCSPPLAQPTSLSHPPSPPSPSALLLRLPPHLNHEAYEMSPAAYGTACLLSTSVTPEWSPLGRGLR